MPTGNTHRVDLQRASSERADAYARRVIAGKAGLLHDALAKGLPTPRPGADICYLVAPQYFWNVGWDQLRGDEDIGTFFVACLSELQAQLRLLMSAFPQERCGKISLLPGSLMTLVRQVGAAADAADARPRFEAMHFAPSIDNFGPAGPDNARAVRMWPKREPSAIDFDDDASLKAVSIDGRDWYEASVARSNFLVAMRPAPFAAAAGQPSQPQRFDNAPAGGVPFGIDIGTDYVEAYGGVEHESTRYARVGELASPDYLLDFVLTCGTPIDADHRYAASVQYVIWCDGSNGAFCRIYKLAAPRGEGDIRRRSFTGRVGQTALPFELPCGAKLHDAWLDMQPAGGYPSMANAPWEIDFLNDEDPLS